MLFSKSAALTIALAASHFLGVQASQPNEPLKRALIDAGFSDDKEASLLGATAGLYKGADLELLGDDLAAATASAGIGAGIPGIIGAGADGAVGGSILRRSSKDAQIEVFRRFLNENGFDADSSNVVDEILATAKRSDEEGAIMRRQLTAAFGAPAAKPVAKRQAPSIPASNKVGIVKRALVDAGFSDDKEASLLGATAGLYKGADAELLGDDLAAATASAGVGAGIPGIIGAGADAGIGGSILKRALIDAGISGDVEGNLLGATAGAYAGADGEILGDHLAAATASAGIGAGLPGVIGAGADAGIGGSILKRALIDAGFSDDKEASLLGATAGLYKGADLELLGDDLAAATASAGVGAGIPGIIGAGADAGIGGSILKRALIDAGISGDVEGNLLGATAGAYAGADGEILGDHLAAATASAGVGAGIPGIIGAGADAGIGGSILKRALIDAGFSDDKEASLLGATAGLYKGADAELLGDDLAAATASAGVGAGIPGIIGAGADAGIGGSILKRALIDAGFSDDKEASLLGATAGLYKGADLELLGDDLAAATASAGVGAGIPGIIGAGADGAVGGSILRRALIDAGISGDVEGNLLGATAGAYAGADGEILGDHLAAATASAGIGAGIPGIIGAGADGAVGGSIL